MRTLTKTEQTGLSPAGTHPRVVLVIDNAPWHAGATATAVLVEHPHLELDRLPSHSPQLNVTERFWALLRRRAAHYRLFDTVADLTHSARNSLRYFQTVRSRIRSLVADCYLTPVSQTVTAGP